MSSSLISVVNKSDVDIVITSQTVSDDGRERHANGKFTVAAGKSKDLLIDEETSLHVEQAKPVFVEPADIQLPTEGDAQ